MLLPVLIVSITKYYEACSLYWHTGKPVATLVLKGIEVYYLLDEEEMGGAKDVSNTAKNDFRGSASSVGTALNCRAGGSGFDSRGRTNTQDLKITEK